MKSKTLTSTVRACSVVLLLATATLMTASSLSAQSAVLKVDVPFNFTVGNTFLPAGSYAVGFDSIVPNMLVIQDQTKIVRASAYVERGLLGPGNQNTLIFHRYGDQYFLSELHFDSASNGVSVPASKREREAGRLGGKEEAGFLNGSLIAPRIARGNGYFR